MSRIFITAGDLEDGRIQVFAIDSNGNIESRWKETSDPNSGWTGWSSMIYRDFLPAALAEGRFVAAPEPCVVGHGSDRIPVALDRHRRGVSASKLVVRL